MTNSSKSAPLAETDKGIILLVRHAHDAGDDRVNTHLKLNGYEGVNIKPFAGESLQTWLADEARREQITGCVIFGGPYNAYDTALHPFLREEYALIDHCLQHDLPLLGICQGAQQIALHLGAKVGPLPSEICEFGYYPIYPVAQNSETRKNGDTEFLQHELFVTQAHFHTFDLPSGARHLARSEQFENQAFSIGQSTFGLQYHAEQTIEGFRRWQQLFTGLAKRPGAQPAELQTQLMLQHDRQQAEWYYRFLGRLWPMSG